MKYKLICSDLDDTLLKSDGTLSTEVKSAIKKFENAGGKFCMVTGRMTVGAIPMAKELNLHGEIITYQGAVVSDIDSGEILYSATIPCEDAVKIGKFTESLGVYYQTYIGNKFYTKEATEATKLYKKLTKADYEETEIELSKYIEFNKISPPKIMIIAEVENVPIILRKMNNEFGDKYLINTSKPFLIEIIPQGVSKGVAVKNLAEKYGIKREEIVCIGDSDNDLTMLSYAGLSVCVNNGSENAKKEADLIAPSADDDGVAWTINEIVLK